MIYCITIIIIVVLLYMCGAVWVERDDKYMINYICDYIDDKVSVCDKELFYLAMRQLSAVIIN